MLSRTLTPLLIALALLTACEDADPAATDDTSTEDTSADTAQADVAPGDTDGGDVEADLDAVEADTAPGPVGGCAADALEACAYAPAASYAQIDEDPLELSYVDATGFTRQVRVQVRRPQDASEPLPVIVWSHGGASGRANPITVAESWGGAFVEAGYIFVAVAHLGRDEAQRQPLCSYLGYDVEGCASFKYLNWDRPHDVRAVLDWLEEQAAGPLEGRLDTSRVLYAGHSAGAGSAMMVAGATRDYAGNVTTLSDDRPVAFIGCSPQGPGEEGFSEESFAGVARPFLTLTGAGDDTTGSVAENRRAPFTLMPEGDKALGWIEEEGARHTTFKLEVKACEDFGEAASRCEAYRTWLRSAALAFADAHLRDRPEARAWLDSTNAALLSGGAMEWLTR